jgi:DNA uptake protein ComE-like DNA-binding protein
MVAHAKNNNSNAVVYLDNKKYIVHNYNDESNYNDTKHSNVEHGDTKHDKVKHAIKKNPDFFTWINKVATEELGKVKGFGSKTASSISSFRKNVRIDDEKTLKSIPLIGVSKITNLLDYFNKQQVHNNNDYAFMNWVNTTENLNKVRGIGVKSKEAIEQYRSKTARINSHSIDCIPTIGVKKAVYLTEYFQDLQEHLIEWLQTTSDNKLQALLDIEELTNTEIYYYDIRTKIKTIDDLLDMVLQGDLKKLNAILLHFENKHYE